jgi:hypothetical protein
MFSNDIFVNAMHSFEITAQFLPVNRVRRKRYKDESQSLRKLARVCQGIQRSTPLLVSKNAVSRSCPDKKKAENPISPGRKPCCGAIDNAVL